MSTSVVKMTFDIEVAKEVGSDAAIMLSNIQYWVFKNAANDKNLHDGMYWTYNSVRAFTEIFEWLSRRQVRTCLDKLLQKGYLLDNEFNEDSRDRTKWYTTSPEFTQLPKSKMELTEKSSSGDRKVSSYKEHIINTNNKLYPQTENSSLKNIEVNNPVEVKSQNTLPDMPSNFMVLNHLSMWETAWMQAPKHVKKQKTKVIDHFDSKVLSEAIPYEASRLFGRLKGVFNNWKPNNDVAVERQTARKMMQ